MKPRRILWTAVVLVVCASTQLSGQAPTDVVLQTVDGVGVVVEKVGPEATEDGLRREDIRRDVELRLRSADIPVLSVSERMSAPSQPYLYVNVQAMKVDDLEAYVYNIEVELQQTVSLQGAGTWPAVTWDTPDLLGIIAADDLRDLRDEVKDQVDRFANAYLKAHESPSEPTGPTGAASPAQAVREFLSGAAEFDVDRMGRVFGTKKGPAVNRFGQTEVRNRMAVLSGLLQHDEFTISVEDGAGSDKTRVVAELTGTAHGAVEVPFTVVRARDGRWYIQRLETDPLTTPNNE